MSADAERHLEVIEKRLDRLEQLINVVLEKQERLSRNSENAVLFALRRMEGHIERSFEDSTNEILADMRWQSDTERKDQ